MTSRISAMIYAVPVAGTEAFEWRWCTHHGGRMSSRSFALYFDCVEDARRKGYRVLLGQVLTGVKASASRAIVRKGSNHDG
jgi:hypothetical protein